MKDEFDRLNSLSDEEMIKCFDKIEPKVLKKWMFLGLDHTEYFRIYHNLVKYDEMMDEKVRNIFFNDLKNKNFLSSMFECVKKIIPCLENDYVNLPTNINKYLVKDGFSYIDLCAMTHTSVSELIKFVKMLKKYDDGRFFNADQYVMLERFLNKCLFGDKNSFFDNSLLENKFDLDKELSVKRVIKNHEVSRDDVSNVISFLDKWQIPKYLLVYRLALRRFIDGELVDRYYAFSDYSHSNQNDMGRSR